MGIFEIKYQKVHHQLSNKLAKNTNKKIVDLETKLKHFEKDYENYVENIDYKVCKQQLDAICEEKT